MDNWNGVITCEYDRMILFILNPGQANKYFSPNEAIQLLMN